MTQTLEDEDLRKLVVLLGQRFAAVCAEFLPRLGAAVITTEKKVKFSADVTLQLGADGLIEAALVPRAPKLPTEDMAPMPFLIALGAEQQLELAFAGSREEFESQIRAAPPLTPEELEEDAYQPVDNAAESSLEDRVVG